MILYVVYIVNKASYILIWKCRLFVFSLNCRAGNGGFVFSVLLLLENYKRNTKNRDIKSISVFCIRLEPMFDTSALSYFTILYFFVKLLQKWGVFMALSPVFWWVISILSNVQPLHWVLCRHSHTSHFTPLLSICVTSLRLYYLHLCRKIYAHISKYSPVIVVCFFIKSREFRRRLRFDRIP